MNPRATLFCCFSSLSHALLFPSSSFLSSSVVRFKANQPTAVLYILKTRYRTGKKNEKKYGNMSVGGAVTFFPSYFLQGNLRRRPTRSTFACCCFSFLKSLSSLSPGPKRGKGRRKWEEEEGKSSVSFWEKSGRGGRGRFL